MVSTRMVNPVIVALDFPTGSEADRMARRVAPHVGGFKVGLELIMSEGPRVLSEIVALGRPVFCDVKLHDIPNTVGAAARQLGRLGVRWITVHAAGGQSMMRAAVEGLSETARDDAGVLAVTVLTSMSRDDLAEVGMGSHVGGQVARLAGIADRCGVEGIVCSVSEVREAAMAAPRLTRVTPGIRPKGAAPGDQARVATPRLAIDAGAALLVVGRPITRASDPARAAQAIADEANVAIQARMPDPVRPVPANRGKPMERTVESDVRRSGEIRMQPPQLSEEQRARALARAGEARRVRAETKELLKTGSMTFQELLDKGDANDLIGGLKVASVLASMPGTGKVKAKRMMETHGIADNRRLRGLGDKQRAALLAEFS